MKANKLLFFSLLACVFVFDASGQEKSSASNISGGTMVSTNDSLSDDEIAERLNSIDLMLARNEKTANCWWYSWLGIYGAATVGQGIVAWKTDDISSRQDMIVSAGTTLVGFAGQLVFPVKSGYDNSMFAKTSGFSRKEGLDKLLKAEQMLKYQAERAKSGKNWQTHALNGAVNMAGGLITCFCFNREHPVKDGLVTFAIGMAVSEIQIWSQPTKAMKDYRQYCSKYGLNGYVQARRPRFEVYSYVSPAGLSIGLGF
jgi:hypothetical protein